MGTSDRSNYKSIIMNTFAVCMLVAASVAYCSGQDATAASECAPNCARSCAVAYSVCPIPGICQRLTGLCNMGCKSSCECVANALDGCLAARQMCLGAATNAIIGLATCNGQMAICATQGLAQCGIATGQQAIAIGGQLLG